LGLLGTSVRAGSGVANAPTAVRPSKNDAAPLAPLIAVRS
jgi:hypothetical protein